MITKTSTKQDRIFKNMEMYHSDDATQQAIAIDNIVRDYQGYIGKVIDKYFASYKKTEYQDMFNTGVIGLLEALPVYDPNKSKPTTFFHFYILHRIAEYVNKEVCGTSAHYTAQIKKINKVIAEMEKEGNSNPSVTDIAIKMNVKAETVARALEMKNAVQERGCGSEDYMDTLIGINAYVDGPDALYEDKEKAEIFRDAINNLPDDEKQVIVRKWGVFGVPKMTNAQISAETGISGDKLRQTLQMGIKHLQRNENMKAFFTDYNARMANEEEKLLSLNDGKLLVDIMADVIDDGEIEIHF